MKRFLVLLLVCSVSFTAEKPVIRVGSKSFTESYVLSEIVSQMIEDAGEATVERKFGLGQTGIAFEALNNGKIDIYTEYTGTISEAILKNPALKSAKEIRTALNGMGLTISDSLGFNNTYALAVGSLVAEKRRLRKISDLAKNVDIDAGFSHEFLERPDCYPRVRERYGFSLEKVKGLAHSLAYEAISKNEIEITDIYSTDAKVKKFGLVVLEDDRHAFQLCDEFGRRTRCKQLSFSRARPVEKGAVFSDDDVAKIDCGKNPRFVGV